RGGTDTAIAFSGDIDADNATTQDRKLVVDAGDSAATIGNVGATQALADLDVTGATINLGGTTINVNDANAAVQTATFTGAVVLQNNVTISTNRGGGDNALSISATIDADAAANNRKLVIDTGDTAMTFGGNVGASQALADLDVTAATINLNAATFDVSAQGGNTVTFTGPVVLGANVTINTTGAGDNSVAFIGSINADNAGTQDRTLAITAGTGTVTFGGNVGAAQALADLDVTAATINLAGTTINVNDADAAVQTATLTGAVVLQNDVTISTNRGGGDNALTISSTIDADAAGNNRKLAIDTGDTAFTFAGNVGASQALADLDVTAATVTLNASTFDVSEEGGNTVTFTGPVRLGANVTINTTGTGDNSVEFISSVNADNAGTQDRTLAITAGTGTVTFGGNVGAAQALADLDVTASTINLNASTFNVNDADAAAATASFNGAVVLGANTVTVSGNRGGTDTAI